MSRPPTGADLVKQTGFKLLIGDYDRYYWLSRTVMLTKETAGGSDPRSITCTAHEIAHARQPRWLHALKWLRPVEAYLEFDARLRAIEYWFVGI